MARLVILSAAEQVAAYLRSELLAGVWNGVMPGGDRLAKELGVGRDTVEAALKQLDKEGVLVNQGKRRGRTIALPTGVGLVRRIRMGLLLSENVDRRLDYMVEIEHELQEAGHEVCTAPRSMTALGMDVKRIAAMVEKVRADAWLVLAASREVLEWFAERETTPVFAIFGRREGLPMAGVGPDKAPAIVAAVRALAGLGHRRIVLLTRKRRRLPEPGLLKAFLDELSAQGIGTGPYNLPDWEETIEGFDARLEHLFRVTPPTALIIDEAPFFVAARHFLGRRGLSVPEDVSLVCTDADPAFDWCKPPISHIRWDSGPVVRRVVQWAGQISRGRKDLRQVLTPAEFVRGGTIGPARELAGGSR